MLEKEIEYLNQMIVKMSDVVNENLVKAFDCYTNYDPAKHYDVNDDIVDSYERLIEELCLDVMIKERPYAKDLRRVSGILKLVSDIERLGDHAEDVLEFSLKLKNTEKHLSKEINSLIKVCLSMVSDAIKSYINNDFELANKVILEDDVVDKAYSDIIEHLINTKETEVSKAFAIYTTLVVKYIERIADHSVNIAEWVIYIISGYYKDKQIF